MVSSISIVVADDHPLLRAGIVEAVSRDPRLKVIGEAATAADACQLATMFRPNLVLLDVCMPGDTFLAVRTILEACPDTKVVMLTASCSEADLLRSLQSGAKGYVLKGSGGAELIRILLAVHEGGAYVPPELTNALIIKKCDRASPCRDLTGREDVILEHVARGLTNKEIALELHVAEKTVKHHMTRIMDKLKARNRVEAAIAHTRATPASANERPPR
ncbi:response regulator transcription factor [Enterovirga sp.]|jgi:DNA-binding NarL/FixJ family response regulator|uniref:LuxR C-terminal-related transcriptional regulator n=1 Tax=Enterovirga sp. TaxID=2026350 RepID=UPI00261FF00A|nr:response regulator transcription factor [Enterovirga sp.]MDB5592277.1 DNA-binding response regulator [Enterovirga sp.]